MSTVSFAEAALIAWGVTDVSQRQRYLRRLATLEAQAVGAVANNTTPHEKAQTFFRGCLPMQGHLHLYRPERDRSRLRRKRVWPCYWIREERMHHHA